MRGARPDHTMQATTLVNEAYLRMVRQEEVSVRDRAHFFALGRQDHAQHSGGLCAFPLSRQT